MTTSDEREPARAGPQPAGHGGTRSPGARSGGRRPSVSGTRSAAEQRWICLDVGETLIDETRVWLEWSRLLDVPAFTFLAAIGATVARGVEDHPIAFEMVGRPDWRDLRPAFRSAYGAFRESDLYPDVKPAIAALRDQGYQIAIVANQPAERTAELRALGIDVDVMAMSDEIGLWKPDPKFFQRVLELMGNPEPDRVAYVGDRLDNDVRPAVAAGMRAVWLRRGPWGVIGDGGGPPPETALMTSSLMELAERATELWATDPTVLRLTVVGSSPAWSLQAGRPSSCYLVELGDDAVVLDLGQGSLGALAERRRPETILAILVSHLHPDHHADLVPLRHYMKFGRGGERATDDKQVALHLPGDLRARYDTYVGEHGFLASMPGEDVREGTWAIGPFTVDARPVTHALNSFAFRVSRSAEPDAPALVYSGDCGEWRDLVPLIRRGDTVVCEAFWGAADPEAPGMHLGARDAAAAASEGDASRLVLTHLGDDADRDAALHAAADVFPGEVLIAEPGLALAIG